MAGSKDQARMAAQAFTAADDEEYWEESSVTSSKKNLFDDEEEGFTVLGVSENKAARLSSALRSTAPDLFADDDNDDITWETSSNISNSSSHGSITSAEYRSARYTPPTNRSGSLSTSSSRSTAATVTLGGSQDNSLSVQFSKPKITRSEPMSLEDAIIDVPAKQVTATEVSKLETEIQFLRRQVQLGERARWTSLPVKETIKRIILGQPYSLEAYKSLEDKLALLDAAIKMHDGDAITIAVLFLKKTVRKNIFQQELIKRPVAINHLIHFLWCHYDLDDLEEIYRILGRMEDVFVLKYKQALAPSKAAGRAQSIAAVVRSFQHDSSLAPDSTLLLDQCTLLQRQIQIEEEDKKIAASGKHPVFREHPPKAHLPLTPLTTTLYYCSFYHYNESDSSLSSPLSIKRDFQISDKQYTWSTLNALAKLHRWKEIEALLTSKNWFGGTKMKACIGFEKVVDILSKQKAPVDILSKYLPYIEDPNERLALAAKLKCHRTVVDTLIQLKDRTALEDYRLKTPDYSLERQYVITALNNSQIKWKN
ncbi:PREDICTED: spermatogenesis-defective protein 39 homolog [Branchiostoma belcheri]|uniref:Spermatogenesis-defective protein 39 homolog n=1 Tax=Branchiostoma belcheri TaxID=7741 RepID=A0A6P4ZCC0_BRABE|nr:PREDICTED: spermatogenesis-defective protein 39 homolog [Branchiostoma belcheri]